MRIRNNAQVLWWRYERQLKTISIDTVCHYVGYPDSVEELDCGKMGVMTAFIYEAPKRAYRSRKKRKKEAGIRKSK